MVETGGDWSCEVVTGGGEGGFGDDNVRLKKSIMSSAFVVFNGGGGSVMVKAILNEGSDVGPTCAFECLLANKAKSSSSSSSSPSFPDGGGTGGGAATGTVDFKFSFSSVDLIWGSRVLLVLLGEAIEFVS